MPEPTQHFGPIAELQRLGDAAIEYYWEVPKNEDEKREKEKTLKEFINFFEKVPDMVKDSPSLAKPNLAVTLMRLAITYERMEEEPQTHITAGRSLTRVFGERKILMTAGRVLSRLGEKHPDMVEPAMTYLQNRIQSSGTGWKKHIMPEAYMEREDALEILGWAVVGTPLWATPDAAKLVIEAAFYPLYVDAVMIDDILFDLKKGKSPEELASKASGKARETLYTMMTLNPDLEDEAYTSAEIAKERAERRCLEEMCPVVAMTAERVRDAIVDAVIETSLPEDVVRNILAPSSPDDLAL